MRPSAYRFALPVLVAAVLAAPAGAATLPAGAVHLPNGSFKRVGMNAVQCGFVGGHWVSGTRRLGYWFVSDATTAREWRTKARHASGVRRASMLGFARTHAHRARVQGPACQPLTFRLRGARAVAIHGRARPAQGRRSNLEVVGARGKVRTAIDTGSADVAKVYTAPGGKIYVLFRGYTMIGGGEPTGQTTCDETDDESAGMRAADDEDTGDEEDPGDGEDSGDEEDCEPILTPGIYCNLAELDPTTREPTCVDGALTWVRGGATRAVNDPFQFDDTGAVHYLASTPGATVLRRWLDGQTSDTTLDPNVILDDFLVTGDGDTLITGATRSTGARWVRRVDAAGHISSVLSGSATFLRRFPDGNVYFGTANPGDVGVHRWLAGEHRLDPGYWIGRGTAPGVTHDVGEVCSPDTSVDVRTAFCDLLGSRVNESATTSDGRVFVVAGPADGGRLMEYFPELRIPPSGVRAVSLASAAGDRIALAGVDAAGRRTLVLHDLTTDAEQTLIGGDDEFDVYHLAYDERAGTLVFDGLRFSDNRFVVGQVDLKTLAVTYGDTSTTRWTALQALRR